MSEVLNLVGLGAGVVLYAMLLAMVVRARRTPPAAPFDPLLLATALLGLLWNLCALPSYELPKIGIVGPFPVFIAVGFSALGFLPAVVVHSVLRGRREGLRGGLRRTLTFIAYAVSGMAAFLQMHAAWQGAEMPSVAALRLLTYTFVGLIVPLAAATRKQPGGRRALWAAALAAFAVSALHLSQLHQGDDSWPVELLGHHASVPLALAILYQDYPFALADLFLKRALALLALLAIAFAAIGVFGRYSSEFARLDPRQVGILVAVWVVTALAYPAVRRAIRWFVDAVVLDRPDYESLRNAVARRLQTHDEIAPMLDDLCSMLAPALSARHVTWYEWSQGRDEQRAITTHGDQTIAIVHPTESPRYAIAISQVTGGRRFFSDDLAALEAVSVLAARRIDAIRITRERYERSLRDQELEKLATEAELRTLRAQLNPHFLFNALTTIGYLIQAAPTRALSTLMRLTSLLRAVLRSESDLTTLGRELQVVEAYLEIERARFDERLRFSIDVPPSLAGIRVPPLILQPLVENAVKHGISRQRLGGEVRVGAGVERQRSGKQLILTVTDTGAGASLQVLERGREGGLGLRNLARRLECLYGADASLHVSSTPNAGTVVEVRLPVQSRDTSARTLEHAAS